MGPDETTATTEPPRWNVDYVVWGLCSFGTFAALGFIPYGRPRVNFWQECVRAVRDNGDVCQLIGAGTLIGATSALFGWMTHYSIVERFGRLTDRPADQVEDYDDRPPAD